MNTKQRILTAALSMFNEQGERQVTTNHLAEALGMSPGNLYYHYKNKKEIVLALFQQYQAEVVENLSMPTDRPLNLNDKFSYLDNIFSGLWRYRFLHRDLEHFLQTNEPLKEAYQAFFKLCLSQTMAIYRGLKQASIIQIDDEDIQPLAINTWLIVTSWVAFSHDNLASESTLLADDQSSSARSYGGKFNDPEVTDPAMTDTGMTAEALIVNGMKQVLALEKPYLIEPYRTQLQQDFLNYSQHHLQLNQAG